MAQSIVLILTNEVSLKNTLTKLGNDLNVILKDNGSIQFLLESEGCYIDFSEMDNRCEVMDDYKTNELLGNEFKKNLKNCSFYLISHNSLSLLRYILLEMTNLDKSLANICWVDDDAGNIYRLPTFLKVVTR